MFNFSMRNCFVPRRPKPNFGVVRGTDRIGPRAVTAVSKLFRPWAEYIIGYRLVKLVQSFASKLIWLATVRMTEYDSTSAEPLILAVETSSKATSIAVARGAQLLRSIRELPDQKRSETLWREVKAVLAELGLVISDVGVFAVCTGPGGFTGLRVGMAAVMGFSAATNKPLVGVTSLEATAFAAGPADAVVAIVNAYKGEVYSQLFSFDGGGVPVAQNDPMVSTPEEAIERVAVEENLVFACNGVDAVAQEVERIVASRGDGTIALKQSERGLAEAVAQVGFLKYARGETQTAATLKASYVRPSEAEIKLSLGLLGSKIKRSMRG